MLQQDPGPDLPKVVYGLGHMVYGIWYILYGIWYILYGIWYILYGIWYMVYGSYHMTGPDRRMYSGVSFKGTPEFLSSFMASFKDFESAS